MSQKRFLLLVYCLRFDDSTTRAQRRADDKLAPIGNIYDKFVAACEANYTPGTGCTVESEEDVVSSNTHKINRANTASRYMFWLIAKPSIQFLPKFTWELALVHRFASPSPSCFGFERVNFGNKQKYYY